MIAKRDETELIITLRKIYPYLSILFLCLAVAFVYYRSGWVDENYPPMNIIETNISGKIIKFPPSLSYGGRLLVNLNSGNNFSIGNKNRTFNYRYKPSSLDSFLQVGDSIYSSKHEDIGRQIYVYRDGKEYYFILSKKINR